MSDTLKGSIAEIGAALRAGTTSAAALLAEASDNHLRHQALDAYKIWDADGAARNAAAADAALAGGEDRGPLHGLPVSVKDLYGVEGLPCRAGTPHELPASFQREGPVVSALRQARAVIVGKTHTVECAFGGLGTNAHWPTPRNPWDSETHRVPGGSSSGAGVSLAEGSAVLALGSDTGGSVRVPASMTGAVGLKTSFGRWSLDGIFPLSPSYDTAGVLARSVADTVAGFAAIDPGRDPWWQPEARPLTGLRIGVAPEFFWAECSEGISEAVRGALDELGTAGAILVDTEIPECTEAIDIFRNHPAASAELVAFLSRELPHVLASLGPSVHTRLGDPSSLLATDYLDHLAHLHALAVSAGRVFADIDVLAGPTVPVSPPAAALLDDADIYRANNMLALRNTAMANMFEQCAITLPVGLDALGLPVGLQLAMPLGEDAELLGAALIVEACLGTARARLGAPPAIGAPG